MPVCFFILADNVLVVKKKMKRFRKALAISIAALDVIVCTTGSKASSLFLGISAAVLLYLVVTEALK